MIEAKESQVFDPIVNKGLAVMLDSERKKICGIMGDGGADEIDCPVDLASCPYCFLMFGSCDQSECALKMVSRVMKGWKEPEPYFKEEAKEQEADKKIHAPKSAKGKDILKDAMACLQPAEVEK